MADFPIPRSHEVDDCVVSQFRKLAESPGISYAFPSVKEAPIILSRNENPFGPSPLAVAAIGVRPALISRYPDPTGFRIRERISGLNRVSPDQVILGNGSNEIIEMLARLFCAAGRHVVSLEPSFPPFKSAALANGAELTSVPFLASLINPVEELLKAIRPETRLLFLANPNNPTGTYIGKGGLESLIRSVPKHVLIVLDEAYQEYADATDFVSGIGMLKERGQLFILRTFSKIYGLAGLRIGFGIGTEELVRYLNLVRMPFNVNSCAQESALGALSDFGHLESSRRRNISERDFLTSRLIRMGYGVVPSQANFLFVECSGPAAEVHSSLLGRGILVSAWPGYPNHLRISLGTRTENRRLVAALQVFKDQGAGKKSDFRLIRQAL